MNAIEFGVISGECHIRLVLIADYSEDVIMLKDVLEKSRHYNFEIKHVLSLLEAERYFLQNTADMALLELEIEGREDFSVLSRAREFLGVVPLITLVTAKNAALGMESLKVGVQDYILKDAVHDNENKLPEIVGKSVYRAKVQSRDNLRSAFLEHIRQSTDTELIIKETIADLRAYTRISNINLVLYNADMSSFSYYDNKGKKIKTLYHTESNCEHQALAPIALYQMVLGGAAGRYPNNSSARGSFWVNNFPEFFEEHVKADSLSFMDCEYIAQRYSSLALIPLQTQGDIIGLLQLVAKDADRIMHAEIEFLEDMAMILAVILQQNMRITQSADNEIKFRTIFEFLHIGIIVEDIGSTGIVMVNARARELTGMTEEVIIEKGIRYFFPDLAAGTDRLVEEYFKPHETYMCSDARSIHVLRATKVVTIRGSKLRIISFSDLTDKDKSQEKVIKLSRFPNENPYPVLRVAVSGKILYHNAAGRDFLPYICADNNNLLNPAFFKLIKDCFDSGALCSQEVNCGERLYSIYLRPILEENYVNIYGVDITDQRRIEKQLRHSEKMQAIGQLAGGIAHEFNNQLAVINGFSELVLGFPPVAESAKYSNMLQEVIRAGERAADLTRQLLTYCRQKEVYLDIIDVNEIILDMEMMLQRIIGEDIALLTNLETQPYLVEIDKGQLSDVLINLCANARDAMTQGGRIVVTTENGMWHNEIVDDENAVLSGPYIRITVADTGQGMDEDTIKRIFEPFFTTKPVGKGTGLGLAMVYGVVKERRGTIAVRSNIGKGSVFELCFPASEKQNSSASSTSVNETVDKVQLQGSDTIIVVEDENGVLMYVTTVLRDAGYTVLQSNNPIEAIRLFERNLDSISIILSDVVMPEMSGFELIKRLREQKPLLKAVCMSGYSQDMLHKKTDIEGDIPIINKPVSPTELLMVIDRIKNKI